MGGELLLSRSETVWSPSGNRPMSVVSASFWHVNGMPYHQAVPATPSVGIQLRQLS